MKMQGRRLFVGALATILVTACLGFAAGGSHKSQERKADVTFSTMTKFNNGTTLPAGTYRMEVPENSQTPASNIRHRTVKSWRPLKPKWLTSRKRMTLQRLTLSVKGMRKW